MSRRLANQDGFSIVTAVMLLGLMLSSGLAAYAYVDTGQDQSRTERVDESAFNLTEGVLNAQTFILSNAWPREASEAYPPCTPNTTTAACPQESAIDASFTGIDHQTGAPTWTTTVHDDNSGSFFDPETAGDWPAFDANGNDRVWVRAQASYTVGSRPVRSRALVALVQVETLATSVEFPDRTVIAGKFQTTNNGKKTIVETNATQTSPHHVTLRCASITNPSCAKYRSPDQVTPPQAIVGGQYVDSSGNPLPALPVESQQTLRQIAQDGGTYYASGCPSASALAAGLSEPGVVWVDTGSCSYTGNTSFGGPSAPGVLVLGQGTLSLGGTTNFYGVVYALNRLNIDGWVVSLNGNTEISGRVFIDGAGGLSAGSSKLNVSYNGFEDVDQGFTTYGAAGIVQNSWREITPTFASN